MIAFINSDGLCPICSNSTFSNFKYGLLSCQKCELVLSKSIWEQSVNEKMEDAWFGNNYVSRNSSIWVSVFEYWKNYRTLNRLPKLGKNRARLLEVGVGSGSFLSYARSSGYDVSGCDLSSYIAESVISKLSIPMHCGSVFSIPDGVLYDVIVINHVLEHVENPVLFLQSIFRLLAPRGVVHIAVPNVDCLEANFSGWTSFEPYHLTYFNSNTLIKTAKLAGFEISDIFTSESFSGWPLTILRTLLGLNLNITSSDSSIKNSHDFTRSLFVEHAYRISMLIIGLLLFPLRWLQARFGYGDECILIARKI